MTASVRQLVILVVAFISFIKPDFAMLFCESECLLNQEEGNLKIFCDCCKCAMVDLKAACLI